MATSGSPESRVTLVTGPIVTGKTTRLRAWAEGQAGGTVAGILAPVVAGQRHLLDVVSGRMKNLEDLSGGAERVVVRRFTFNADVFAWARELLLRAVPDAASAQQAGRPEWVIVDEIGPLELAGGGLEPAVGEIVRRVRPGTRLVLVIREGLVDAALDHLGLAPDAVEPFPFLE